MGQQTWLTPFASVWRQKFPESVVPFKQLAQQFKDLVKAHPPERIVQELSAYLDQTEPRFVSLARFVAMFGTWTRPEKSPLPPSRCVFHPDRDWVATSKNRRLCRECFDREGA